MSAVLIAVLLLKLGFQAGASSTTKIFFNALIYESTVSVSKENESFIIISFFNVSLDT